MGNPVVFPVCAKPGNPIQWRYHIFLRSRHSFCVLYLNLFNCACYLLVQVSSVVSRSSISLAKCFVCSDWSSSLAAKFPLIRF